MSYLFRSSFSAKRENIVKEALLNTLSENAREIQYEFKENGRDYLEQNDSTNSLCTTLEAIFLHGLKDSFLWQTFNVISGDVNRRPEPSFWSPILVFMHKQVIKQIATTWTASRTSRTSIWRSTLPTTAIHLDKRAANSCHCCSRTSWPTSGKHLWPTPQPSSTIQTHGQIISEIGYCRSWVRLSLNESLFSSYFNNIRKNGSALNPYYKNFAFLKDFDLMEVASKILEGIESCVQINLPVNSSLLNQWPNYSLQLAGLWASPLKSCPITSGFDVASSITEVVAIPSPKPVQTNEFFSESISNSPFSRTSNFACEDLTHRENLEIFLQKVEEMERIVEEPDDIPNRRLDSESQTIDKKSHDESYMQSFFDQCNEEKKSHGNSLTNLMHTSWSSELVNENLNNNSTPISERVSFVRSTSNASSLSSMRSPIDRCSYNTLLKKHEDNRTVDWTDVWEKFIGLQSNVGECGDTRSISENDSGAERTSNNYHDFEIIPHSVSEKFEIDELQEMVKKLCKLAQEPGLDAQGFLCKSCAHPLGMGFSTAKVCSFSGNYYCEACMDGEQLTIPAKIIYNWDFRKYAVSKRASAFLAEFQYQPFIDLKLLNPDIYHASDQMAELQSLRIQLNFIRAYLYTCCPSSIEELQRLVFMKDYLFEHIHQYSIFDLNTIQRGILAQQLQKAVNSGQRHILNCALCKVKGFICEICNSSKVLYPFHIDTIYRCKLCGAVFHAGCLNEMQPCPKCERRRKRRDLPLFEAIQNMI